MRRVLQLLPSRVTVAREMARDAFEQQGQRAPRAPRVEEAVGEHRIGAHPGDPLPGRSRLHQRHSGSNQLVLAGGGTRERGQAVRFAQIAGREAEAGGRQREQRIGGQVLLAEERDPRADHRVIATPHLLDQAFPQEAPRSLRITRLDGVVDRAGRVSLRLTPLARAPVERGYPLGLAAAQLRAKHVRKQPLVPIPGVASVERHEHGVGASEAGKHVAGSAALQYCVAQRPRQAPEHRGPGEELELLA